MATIFPIIRAFHLQAIKSVFGRESIETKKIVSIVARQKNEVYANISVFYTPGNSDARAGGICAGGK